MKRAVWFVVIILAAAAVTWAVTRSGRPNVDLEIERAAALGAPQDRIAALVDIAQNADDLGTEQFKAIDEGISNAAYEGGEASRLVAVCDSLLALPLPKELAYRLTAELHGGLVIQGYYTEDDQLPYWERASEIARGLLAGDDVPPDVRLQVAGFHGYALGFAPVEEVLASRDHWTPYELAAKGINCIEEPISTGDAAIVSTSLGWALGRIAESYGAERAIAVTDSMLAEDPCPSLRAVILEQRYWVAVDSEPELAVAAAKKLSEVGRYPGLWPLLRSVSLDLSNRGLAPQTALDLADTAMELVESRRDSGRVFFAIGAAELALSHPDKAATALEMAVARGDEEPELDGPQVASLLSAYEASSQPEKAVDLLARLIAHSVLPNDEAREKLAALLEAQGRSRDEIPAIVESQRYAGVSEAHDFTLVDRDGNDVSLAGLRGNVVLLCFWSYG